MRISATLLSGTREVTCLIVVEGSVARSRSLHVVAQGPGCDWKSEVELLYMMGISRTLMERGGWGFLIQSFDVSLN